MIHQSRDANKNNEESVKGLCVCYEACGGAFPLNSFILHGQIVRVCI